jgi:hypothetical protein
VDKYITGEQGLIDKSPAVAPLSQDSPDGQVYLQTLLLQPVPHLLFMTGTGNQGVPFNLILFRCCARFLHILSTKKLSGFFSFLRKASLFHSIF